jgi:GNAT superfamily N-acetyltransferase
VRIEQFDAKTDDNRLTACHQIFLSGHAEDDPNMPPVTWRRFQAWWRYGFADEPFQTWLATNDAGDPVGCYLLWLPERENRQNAFCGPTVALPRRRHGIGTALLAHAARQAEQADRTVLMTDTRVGAPGNAFAAACGARAGLQEVRRVLDIDASLIGRLADLRASAEQHAAGYSLRSWSGMTPDDLLDQACTLHNAMEDAPHDAAFEPLRWDAGRLRKDEEQDIEAGTRINSVAVLADDPTEMAALTQVYVDPDQAEWGYQGLTAVTRQHRGHRLGMLVKTAMLDWLAKREPELREIVTGNAATNKHMIAVNAELGFRVSDHFQNWELDVAAARKLATALRTVV